MSTVGNLYEKQQPCSLYAVLVGWGAFWRCHLYVSPRSFFFYQFQEVISACPLG